MSITQQQINQLSEIIEALSNLPEYNVPTGIETLRTATDLAIAGQSILIDVEQALKTQALANNIAYARTNFS